MNIENVSRRGFLQSALVSGAFVLSARFIPEPLWASEGEAAASWLEQGGPASARGPADPRG